MATIPPTSLFIVLVFIVLITSAAYISMRAVNRTRLPLLIAGALCVFLTSSVLSGFSPINLLLIVAITTLLSILLK